MEEYIIIGNIVNTHGLKGELRILSDSDFKDERFKKGAKLLVLSKDGKLIEEVIVRAHRTHKNFDLLMFKYMDHISHVEKYKGHQLAVKYDDVDREFEAGTYYYSDIFACNVISNGTVIGKVHDIVETPAYDLWYIKRDGKKDLALPHTDEYIKNIDIKEGLIEIELLDGMDEL